MAEQRNSDRFKGLIPREGGFVPDDFIDQAPAVGRFGYLAGSNFEKRPLQGNKYSKRENKKRK